MASIQGILLRGVKTFEGHECTAFLGNVYQDRKKLGRYIQHGDGGEGTFDSAGQKALETLMEAIRRHYAEHPPVDSLQCYGITTSEFMRVC